MIRLTVPEFHQEEENALLEVLRSGMLVQGKKVEELEQAICRRFGVDHAIVVSSGTAALHLSLLALDIAGGEVIVPAFTFPATANVVEMTGNTTRLVDITCATFGAGAGQIEACITPRTKAVIPVHEFGLMSDTEGIIKAARRVGIPVIEDAACAMGATDHGKFAGTIGDLGCFSLHPRKAITTGEGGIIVTDDPGLAARLRKLRNHGMERDDQGVRFVMPGLNYRMTDLQAAIGCIQISRLDSHIRRHRELASRYSENLRSLAGVRIPVEPDGALHTFQTYHLLLDERVDRDETIRFLYGKGIESNLGAHAVHCQPYYQNKYGWSKEDFPEAYKAYRQGLALPLHYQMTEADVDYISASLEEAVERYGL